ncbi:hypothetical protein CANINC_000508 [Pichia inconspicua]|uniref:4-hydroxyphenylpyruvate dioxygenase n=1 Tax=Pichia inconspicua TaxID=52247 RepID=A0A4T0X5Z4_9ASCO|nr:hypothetical protein CANINC_000508 [[Candida] inconspicua]
MTVTEVNIKSKNSSNTITDDFDHILFYVSSPKLVANHICRLFGFKLYAYLGLETGSRDISATAIKNGNVIFVFMGAIRPLHREPKNQFIDNIHKHIATHGDGVKDVAFKTLNIDNVLNNLKLRKGLHLLINNDQKPDIITDNFGTIKMLTIKGINDTVHTFIDRSNYTGFLPGFQIIDSKFELNNLNINLSEIDHCVQNEDWNRMDTTCQFYQNYLNFHVFWSVDETQVSTPYSALKSTVVTNENEKIKMPINEPAIGLKKSQIEEFIDFNDGPGIQHIALRVENIIDTIKKMKQSGVQFIDVPDSYYDNLEKKLKITKHPKIKENIKSLKKHGILIDFDENGYLLQLFTKNIFERPTFFFEIIQRSNHNGFGAGNFKSLFEVLEKDQEQRGNLTTQRIEDRTRGLEPIESNTKEISDDDIANAIDYFKL